MIIDDSGLTIFALGVATSIGVVMAILVAMIIFNLDRWSRDDREASDQIRENANRIYELFLMNSELAGRYFQDIPDYNETLMLFVTLSESRTNVDVPNFATWRVQTESILQIVSTYTRNLPRIDTELDDFLVTFDPDVQRFHTDFVQSMTRIDAGIQLAEWARTQRRIVKQTSWGIILAGVVLIASLTLALLSEITTATGIKDGLNVWVASLLLVMVVVLVIWLASLIRYSWETREESIQKLARKLQSDSRKNS